MYGNSDGSIPATFQIIYMIAWKPDPSQVNIYKNPDKMRHFYIFCIFSIQPKPLPQQKPDVSLKDLDKLK